MQIQQDETQDCNALFAKLAPFLLQQESLNNLLLDWLEKHNQHFYKYFYAATITKDDGELLLVLLVNDNNMVNISAIAKPELQTQIVQLLAQFLSSNAIPNIVQLVAPKSLAQELIPLYQPQAKLNMHHLVYEVTSDTMQVPPYQEPEHATLVHVPSYAEAPQQVLGEWMYQFSRDIHIQVVDDSEQAMRERQAKMLSFYANQKRIHMYKIGNDQYVSMLIESGVTPHGSRIGWVYTPKEYRGKSYASWLVYRTTEYLLAQPNKKRLFLFTDANNTTSNKIYMQIGYQFLGEALLYMWQ